MSEETKPAWMMNEGLDADMSGDVKSGANSWLNFWIPKGEERTIIFLTEGNKARVIWEHNLKLGGKWNNFATCLQPLGTPCPLCTWAEDHEGAYARYKVTVLSIVDTFEFKDRTGKMRKNERRIMRCKKDTTEILKRKYLGRIEAGQGLRGAMYKAFRANSDKSAAVGTDFEFVKMIDIASLPESEELDLGTILAPNPALVRGMVERLKRAVSDVGESSGVKTDGTDDKVEY